MRSIRCFPILLMVFSLFSVPYLVTSVSAQGGNTMDPNQTMQGSSLGAAHCDEIQANNEKKRMLCARLLPEDVVE